MAAALGPEGLEPEERSWAALKSSQSSSKASSVCLHLTHRVRKRERQGIPASSSLASRRRVQRGQVVWKKTCHNTSSSSIFRHAQHNRESLKSSCHGRNDTTRMRTSRGQWTRPYPRDLAKTPSGALADPPAVPEPKASDRGTAAAAGTAAEGPSPTPRSNSSSSSSRDSSSAARSSSSSSSSASRPAGRSRTASATAGAAMGCEARRARPRRRGQWGGGRPALGGKGRRECSGGPEPPFGPA
mmetsp:Transcript_104814/g.306101  ORF Transcript_104814/g.306101 Transcript_104814/m.306101 type:complete len:243 (+) Transcript_104814:682-1410(+)